MLVVVVSSPKNYDQRKFIRGSWGREAKLSSSAEILFLVGLSDEHTNQGSVQQSSLSSQFPFQGRNLPQLF